MKILLLFISLFCVHFTIRAQTVEEIITKYTAARGGIEKLKAIKTIHMEGSCIQFGKLFKLVKNIENKKFYRADQILTHNTFSTVINSDGVWHVINKKAKKIPDSIAYNYQYRLDIEGSLVDYISKGHKVELLGKDTATGGQQCYKIKFTSNIGVEIIYWIDTVNYFKVQSSIMERSMIPNKYGELESRQMLKDVIFYKNYKNINGIIFPYVELMNMYNEKGELVNTINTYYEIIEIDKPLKPRVYKLK